jgi:hypothetical protein
MRNLHFFGANVFEPAGSCKQSGPRDLPIDALQSRGQEVLPRVKRHYGVGEVVGWDGVIWDGVMWDGDVSLLLRLDE